MVTVTACSQYHGDGAGTERPLAVTADPPDGALGTAAVYSAAAASAGDAPTVSASAQVRQTQRGQLMPSRGC